MKCPTSNKLVLASMNLLDEPQAEAVREHVELCAACRERLNEARRGHVTLMRAYEALDQNHDSLREQLMASLPEAGPTRERAPGAAAGLRRLGDFVMTHPKSRRAAGLLAVAAAIAFAFILFFDSERSVAFADVLERLRQVHTIVCHISGGTPQAPGEGQLYLSDVHGARVDLRTMDGEKFVTGFTPPGGESIVINWQQKQYMVLSFPDNLGDTTYGNRLDAWLAQLRQMSEEPDRYLGRGVIDGRAVEGFEIDGAKLGIKAASSTARLWVDPKTQLPVQFVLDSVAEPPGDDWHATYDRFEFDVPLDAEFFKPEIPEGFVRLGLPEISEATLLNGLRDYADLVGRYPSELNLEALHAGLRNAVGDLVDKGELSREPSDPRFIAFGQKILGVQMGCAFYQQLVDEGRAPEYFGRDVTPDAADAVLLRWRLDDGGKRVIYGDLRVETRPAD